jgi:hypothetical protein
MTFMGQFDSLIGAANKAIKSARALLETENPPFNVMYKQFKTIQSFWFRVVEDASDTNSRRLEDLCVDLEEVLQLYEVWIKENSPTRNQTEETKTDTDEGKEEQ